MTEITEEMMEAAAEAAWRAEVSEIGAARRARESSLWADQQEAAKDKWRHLVRAALTAAFASRPSPFDERDATNLLSVIADIREKSGVGAKPMLSELADAIADKIAASRPSQGGEWDNVVLAACRVAWPNFDAFGKESKTKRLKEMREAMLSASPSQRTEADGNKPS